MSMKNRTWRDVVFAATAIPAELYMWLRAGHFVRAWVKFLSRVKVDNWAEQAKAERGSGNAYLMPLIVLVTTFLAWAITWFRLPVMIQSSVLWLGWPVLYVVTIAQTVVMAGEADAPPARLQGLSPDPRIPDPQVPGPPAATAPGFGVVRGRVGLLGRAQGPNEGQAACSRCRTCSTSCWICSISASRPRYFTWPRSRA